MSAITAAAVKELRELSGAGMMDAKKALEETAGDMNAAVDLLRAKGMERASGRLLTDVVEEELHLQNVAVLSGPGFAADIAKLPRIVTLNNIAIVPGKDGALALDATTKTFRYLDEEEVAKQRKAARDKAAKEKGGAK